MRLGATLAQLSPGPPMPIADWAKRLVDTGFESLWVPQLIGRGTFVPDPFVTLAVAATATEGVELGTATVQVPLHHPADLAHRILSLLLVCGDRLTLGLSPGSTDTDFAALDRDYPARFPPSEQNVARLRVLLADGRDERADLAPAGVINGRPPLLLGSWGANVDRAAREFDGWLAAGTPPDAGADHRRAPTVPGRRRQAGDRLRHPVEQHRRPRTHRRGTASLRGRRVRRRRGPDRSSGSNTRTGQGAVPVDTCVAILKMNRLPAAAAAAPGNDLQRAAVALGPAEDQRALQTGEGGRRERRRPLSREPGGLELFGEQRDPRPERVADDVDEPRLAGVGVDGHAGYDAPGRAARRVDDLPPQPDERLEHLGRRCPRIGPVGTLDRDKQLGVVRELTDIVAAAAGDPTLTDRTWVR